MFQHDEFTKNINEKLTILGVVFCEDKGRDLWKPSEGNCWIASNTLNKRAFMKAHKGNVG